MARTFDGVDDIITATITAMDSGNWTMGAWVFPVTAGEGTAGVIIEARTVAPALRQQLRFDTSGRILRASQAHTTTSAVSVTTDALAASAWSLVFATYTAADTTIRIYIGTLSTPMAEASYSTQTAGVGGRNTSGTGLNIGNSVGTTLTFDGGIAHAFAAARLWSLDEMERMRLGVLPVQTGQLRGFWPLDSPTASQAEDLSGNGANGTVTGAIVSEEPPVPTRVA